MRVHEIKSWPESFQAFRARVKLAEFRIDDRDPPYAVGDTLVMREWDPEPTFSMLPEHYTGEVEFARVTHKVEGGVYGVPEGYCVLSIWPMALITGGGPSAATLLPDPPPPPPRVVERP